MSYFDTTVFNRTAQQQKETNDLLRELIKTLQEQKSKCRYPTQNFEPPTQAQQPDGDVVAYLDVGANGYLDLGSELSEDALQQLPKGRHALVIAGAYGIDGYVAAPQPSPMAQAAESVWRDADRIEKWSDRVQRAHPKSEPEFWPDALRVKYMADEISDLRAARAPADSVQEDAARYFFDAGWKACANFCDSEDVVADGITGFGACPQFEAAFSAANGIKGGQHGTE